MRDAKRSRIRSGHARVRRARARSLLSTGQPHTRNVHFYVPKSTGVLDLVVVVVIMQRVACSRHRRRHRRRRRRRRRRRHRRNSIRARLLDRAFRRSGGSHVENFLSFFTALFLLVYKLVICNRCFYKQFFLYNRLSAADEKSSRLVWRLISSSSRSSSRPVFFVALNNIAYMQARESSA